MTTEEQRTSLDPNLYEHLLIGFAKQAVCGLCSSVYAQREWLVGPPDEIVAQYAFDIAEACIREYLKRMPQ